MNITSNDSSTHNNLIGSFHADEKAATVVEYSVMLALIVLVCITAIILLGGEASTIWGGNAQQIGDSINGP